MAKALTANSEPPSSPRAARREPQHCADRLSPPRSGSSASARVRTEMPPRSSWSVRRRATRTPRTTCEAEHWVIDFTTGLREESELDLSGGDIGIGLVELIVGSREEGSFSSSSL